MLLPVGILASAAAVVAAGAIGSQLTSLPRPAEPQPASVHQLSGSVQRSATPGRSQSPFGTELTSRNTGAASSNTGNRQSGLASSNTGNNTGAGAGLASVSRTGPAQLSRASVTPRPSLIRPVGVAPTGAVHPGSR